MLNTALCQQDLLMVRIVCWCCKPHCVKLWGQWENDDVGLIQSQTSPSVLVLHTSPQ